MFGKRKKALPYPYDYNQRPLSNNNKGGNVADMGKRGQSPDILEKMLNSQVISNFEYMELSLLKEILAKLNSIDVNTRSTAVSNEFLGRHILTRFKCFLVKG